MIPGADTRGEGPEGAGAQELVERELSSRALVAERARLLVLAVLGAFPLLGFTLASTVFPDVFAEVFHGRLPVGPSVAGAVVVVLYALGTRHFLGTVSREGRAAPRVLRYVQAAFEVSVPTAMLYMLFRVFDPLLALFTPPLLVYPLIIMLQALRLEPILCVFTGAVAALEYGVLAWVAVGRTAITVERMLVLAPHHVGKAGVLLATGVVTGFTARWIRGGLEASVEAMEDRNRVLDVFGKHVSPEVVNKLLAQRTEMVSEMRDVCIMFLDIRGFTKFSESKQPEEIVEFLNTLFSLMIDRVVEHGGIINKFLGDGFMAIFGAPVSSGRDAEGAVAASLAILADLEREVSAGRLPPTRVGIGLHSGPVVTGHVGSRRRREYTVIGDVVNVASRIESMNKEHGSALLVSGTVMASLGTAPEGAASLGPVTLRGRAESIEIFRLA